MAWVERHLVDNNDSFAKRVVSYMIYLSVFDNAIWGLIFHLFDSQIMPGLVHAAAKIKHDRASFVNLLNVIRGHLVNPVEKAAIHEVLAQAVKIEMEMLSEFKELALGKLDLGRNVDFDLLNQKILFDANRTCSMLNVSALFSVTKNPMVWIDGAYEKEHNRYEENKAVKVVKNTPVKNKEQLAFSLDADF